MIMPIKITEKSLASLLKQPSELLQTLITKSQLLSHLTNLLHQKLDPVLTKHCQVANLREQTLVIEIDSAAWVTQIRYRIPELLEKLQSHDEFRGLQKIEYYIHPTTTEKLATKQMLRLSTENAKILIETADSLPATALKRALYHLATHGEDTEKNSC